MGYRDDWFANNKSNHGWYTCAKCGRHLRKGDADIDHILPRRYGGGDGLDNLQCLCVRCNRSKGASIRNTFQDYIGNNVGRAKRTVEDWF
ncbi:MAG: HNH endonuclease [Schwartzia sp.]|nr:HNH endonuclease [Schwartzia sp. (in: firmicutes)]